MRWNIFLMFRNLIYINNNKLFISTNVCFIHLLQDIVYVFYRRLFSFRTRVRCNVCSKTKIALIIFSDTPQLCPLHGSFNFLTLSSAWLFSLLQHSWEYPLFFGVNNDLFYSCSSDCIIGLVDWVEFIVSHWSQSNKILWFLPVFH